MAFPRREFVVFLAAGFIAGSLLTGTVLGLVVLDRQARILENQEAAAAADARSEQDEMAASAERACQPAGWESRPGEVGLVRLNVTADSNWTLGPRTETKILRDGGSFRLDERNRSLFVRDDLTPQGHAAFVLNQSGSPPQLLLAPCKSLQATWSHNGSMEPGFLLLSTNPYTLRIEHVDPGCMKREIGPGGALERELVSTGLLAGQTMAVTYHESGADCPDATLFYEYEGPWKVSTFEPGEKG